MRFPPAAAGDPPMAKGRKLHHGSDRRDRLLGTYGYIQSHVTTGDLHDLREEDVWSSAAAAADTWSDRSIDRQLGGLSLAFDAAHPTVMHHYRNADAAAARGGGGGRGGAASAVVSVPDWGRILRGEPTESTHVPTEGDEGEFVPPHEYLARESGRTSSVLEGVGRTLKGRDMSRVRDAVWSQTGFFG